VTITVFALESIPEVETGDDIGALIVRAAGGRLQAGDVVVVAHKVVSKAEGRVVAATDKHAAALAEAKRVLRRSGEMIISETAHGYVCANSGVDASNVAPNNVVLLPRDPDLSARRIRTTIARLLSIDVGVIVSDTFGRAWRLGQTNIAIGVAGIDPFVDYRGRSDDFGTELNATRICIADEIAGAAEMVMGKTARVPAAVVRGAPVEVASGSAHQIVRPPAEDLFR
jgi:coenzyme F420-0:L-glutamate ligase / coenzyme F420-1:gamma-L-glutamate ligase